MWSLYLVFVRSEQDMVFVSETLVVPLAVFQAYLNFRRDFKIILAV